MNWNEVLDCGCGSDPDKEEFERIIREIEKDDEPLVIPVEPEEAPIEVTKEFERIEAPIEVTEEFERIRVPVER